MMSKVCSHFVALAAAALLWAACGSDDGDGDAGQTCDMTLCMECLDALSAGDRPPEQSPDDEDAACELECDSCTAEADQTKDGCLDPGC
jgi:hypothetical protein